MLIRMHIAFLSILFIQTAKLHIFLLASLNNFTCMRTRLANFLATHKFGDFRQDVNTFNIQIVLI